ncbi:MAG: hypothetical protein IKA20_04090 [Clostridia bacterium]|nr:hypothetical protein [Clostridia bacterium]
MKSSFKKSKKYFLALCLSALIASAGIGALTACSDDKKADSSTTESSSSSAEATVNDTSLIKNGGFETFSTNNGLNAIGTSVTGWTRSVNSTTSGTALTSRAASGIIDTSSAAWETLTGKKNGDMTKLSEAEAKANWSKYSVAEKLAYYDAWKSKNKDGKIAEDLDFYQAFNIDSEDIPSATVNPGTHHTDKENTDTKVLMIHNEYPSTSTSSTYKTLGTAQKYTSSSTVTVPAGTAAEFSVWVKTAELMCSSSSGESQKAVGKGAYISVSQSVGSKSLPVFSVKNINTEYLDEGSVAAGDYSNGWVKYSFALKGSSYADTTFSVVFGLGQGGGEYRGEYVNGYAFFDDVQCKVVSQDSYEDYVTANFPTDELKKEIMSFESKLEAKTVDASEETSKTKFAFNFYGAFDHSTVIDSFVGLDANDTADHFKATSTKKGDKEYTSEAGNTPLEALNGGLDSKYDVKAVFAGTAKINEYATANSNAYLSAIYNDYFAGDKYATNENILLLMSANGVAYTADTAFNTTTNLGYTFSYQDFKMDDPDTTEVEYTDYLAISFFVKTSDLNGFTGAGIKLKNGNNETTFSSLDTSSLTPVSIGEKGEEGYIEDLYSGWQQCFFFVKNDYVEADKDDVTFSLSFSYGPTTITGTTKDSYYEGFAAFTDFKVKPMSKAEYDAVNSGTYAKTVSVSGVTAEEAAGNKGFDSAANVPSNALKDPSKNEWRLANLQNYTGVYSDSYYVDQKNGKNTDVNTNANAGLLNRDYFIGAGDNTSYYTSDEAKAPAWMNGLTKASGKTTASEVWNTMFGYNSGIGSRTQPLLIWNDGAKDKAYGFIGQSTSIAANSYTKVSVAVKVGALTGVDTANLAAYVYLIDTDDTTYANTLSIGRNLSYWYDNEGNICTGDPAEKDTEVAFYLQKNGLYKANKNWSGYKDEYKHIYYANLDAYTEKDSAGNLLVAEGGASHAYSNKWNNEGEDGIAFYYNEANKVYYADKAKTLPVSNLAFLTKKTADDETHPLPCRYAAENSKQLMAKVEYVGDVWQTVSFYIHTGETAKNYRLEVWSGDRNGAANPADSYVIFDMNYTGDAESNFATLIEENKDNANATSFENVFSYFDSDKYLRYNVELDTNKVGNVYEKSYDATEQTAGVAYLTYTEENETRIFADYSYQDKTVAATIEDDNSNSGSSSESKDKEESDTNVWLLISSIAIAAVLVLAIASIALQKVLKKVKKTATKKAPVKAKKEKATKKAAKPAKKEAVDEDSPYND